MLFDSSEVAAQKVPLFVSFVNCRRLWAVMALQDPHARTIEDVLDHFAVSLVEGLTSERVEEQRKKFGSNELEEQEKKSIFQLIREQFEDLLVRILLLSALVSFFLAHFDDSNHEEGWTAYVEPLVILLILIANAIVGVW